MEDKYVLMGLGDENSKEVAEILSNKTCKAILDTLSDHIELSEKDISKKLGIPINTVEYNLKKLIKVGLIEKTKNYFWSVKGKKIPMYKIVRKHIIISPHKKPSLSALKAVLPMILIFAFIFVLVLNFISFNLEQDSNYTLKRFESDNALLDALKNSQKRGFQDTMVLEAETSAMIKSVSDDGATDYSETNIQVQGVDEADIVKNDGKYIYALSQGNLIIVEAYPAEEMRVLSNVSFGDFNPSQLFLYEDRLVVIGSLFQNVFSDYKGRDAHSSPTFFTSVMVYDITDRENIELLKTYDVEGSYVSSRKIEEYVYFVLNSYPNYYAAEEDLECEYVLPRYKEHGTNENVEPEPISECVDVGYINPDNVESFIVVGGFSVEDLGELEKDVVASSGQNIYASESSLYIVQSRYGWWYSGDNEQKTIISKFSLDDGKVEFESSGEVSGTILNQFSMDEHDDYFRIATTISGYSDNKDTSTNNMYVLDEDMNVVGSVEGIAHGESIYSVRFMGKRAYMVTFKHVDPLFVIDLENPTNPKVLGKLKIPGYSDYLHPYDETHLIGIGKEVDASIDADKVHTEGAVYYTAIQGVKIAIFDVSDVSNPIEMYKEVVGDRGTESLATRDHKAFLFDKKRELLVVPMTVAELKEGQDKSMQGDYTFDGAYVYNVNLKDGFDLKARISHIEDDEEYSKSGYYFRSNSQIQRSLYMDDVLYTISNNMIKANDLNDFEEINFLTISQDDDSYYFEEEFIRF